MLPWKKVSAYRFFSRQAANPTKPVPRSRMVLGSGITGPPPAVTVIDPETMNCITFEGREEPLEFKRIFVKLLAGIKPTEDVPRPMVSKEVLAATTSIPSPIAPEKVSLPGGGPGRPPRLSWRYARRPGP